MEKKIESVKEIDELIKFTSNSYPWYFWSQSFEKTIKETRNIHINYQIKQKKVELVGPTGESGGQYKRDDLVKYAKEKGQDLVAVSSADVSIPKVQVLNFREFEVYFSEERGLFSKKRPWLIGNASNDNIGVKVIFDGFPRSSDKTEEGDKRNEKQILHKSHSDKHKCALNKNGRVLRHYRKSIRVNNSNYICEERDLEFLKRLFNE